MVQSQYIHAVDVFRKFNPQLTEASLEQNDYIGNRDEAQINARIAEVSDQFDDRTRNPLRETRVGSPGTPATYEYHGHGVSRHGWPTKIYLNHSSVLPFDASEGDSFEIRVGRNSWRDFTNATTQTFTLDNRSGTLTLFRTLRRWFFWGAPDDRYVRICYRHGSLGGDRNAGGETTLSASVDDAETTFQVEDVSRLPSSGVVLVNNDEYARIQSVDYDNDTLSVTRGVNATTAKSHNADVTVHFCPASVRSGIASKAAQELLRYDDWVDELVEAAQQLGGKEKMDAWGAEFDEVCAKHSEVKSI